jgi:hypothetical protein
LAYIPPTLAAALIIIDGFKSSIFFLVSSKENRLVSSRVEEMTSYFSDPSKTLLKDFPTNPLLPNITTLIFTPHNGY